jgi:hypothetical protein
VTARIETGCNVYPGTRGNALNESLGFELIEQEPHRPAVHAEYRAGQLKMAMHDVQDA